MAPKCREATMQVIINTDHNIPLAEGSIEEMEALVASTLEYFDFGLTRVEVHLTDGSAGRNTGDDIRCKLEARPVGRNPEFVTGHASTVDGAVSGALAKMKHVLNTTFGRLDHHKGDSSMGGVEPS
jgi:hypothetical protein